MDSFINVPIYQNGFRQIWRFEIHRQRNNYFFLKKRKKKKRNISTLPDK